MNGPYVYNYIISGSDSSSVFKLFLTLKPILGTDWMKNKILISVFCCLHPFCNLFFWTLPSKFLSFFLFFFIDWKQFNALVVSWAFGFYFLKCKVRSCMSRLSGFIQRRHMNPEMLFLKSQFSAKMHMIPFLIKYVMELEISLKLSLSQSLHDTYWW